MDERTKNTVKAILYYELEKLKEDIQLAMLQNRTVNGRQTASGKTIASLEVKGVTEFGGSLYANSYFPVLINGRKPGKLPSNFKEILLEWANYKGIAFASQEEIDNFVFLVTNKIRSRGTLLFRMGGGFDFTIDPVLKFTNRLTTKLANEGTATVFRTVDKYFKNTKLSKK